MMSNDDIFLFVERKATLIPITLRHSAITLMILAISLKTALRKLTHQGHPIITTDPELTHVATTAAGRGFTPSITDVAKGTVLIGQDHVIDLSVTAAQVTTEGMHPAPYLAMVANLITLYRQIH